MAVESDWWRSFFLGEWGRLQSEGMAAGRTAEEVDFLVDALALTPGDRVLDVPCGTGRIAIELGRRGFPAIGVDFNPEAIATGRRASGAADVPVELREGDMRELPWDGEFDAAVCFFGSFGYFEDEENRRFAAAVARALKPGGRWLIDTHVMESLMPVFQNRDWMPASDEPGAARILSERRFDLETRRIETTWTFVDGGRTGASSESSIRLYAYGELCELLRSVGFTRFEGLETLTGKPFDLGSRRLSLVAHR